MYNARKTQFQSQVQFNTSNDRVYSFIFESKEGSKIILYSVNHPHLMGVIGAVLVHREDLCYGVTIFNMAASYYYLSQAN